MMNRFLSTYALDKATYKIYNLDEESGRKEVAELMTMLDCLTDEELSDDGIFFEAMDAYCENWIENWAGFNLYVIDSEKARMLAELASERQHTEGR